jgi:ferric-dicitrate binding protein FerR (iron transport regulator)
MTGQEQIFEQNVQRLLASHGGLPTSLELRLLDSVLAEVRAARCQRRRTLRVVAWWAGAAAAAAAVLLTAVGLWYLHGRTIPKVTPGGAGTVAKAPRIGELTEFYGLVSLRNGGPRHGARPAQEIRSGQRIETGWGSQAQVLLDDQSTFLVQPCSLLQIEQKDAKLIKLESGAFFAEVARQPAGRPLMIQTPAAEIRVLGTKFDVHVVQKATGRRQTRVSVASGVVEMSSAGRTLRLPANTEGIAEEGTEPQRRSLTSEVNEIRRLLEKTAAAATSTGTQPGSPVIIEFNGDATATVWEVMTVTNNTSQPMWHHTLRCGVAQAAVQVFTPEGSPLEVRKQDGAWQVAVAPGQENLPPGESVQQIVRTTGVPGLFQACGGGVFTFDAPGGGTGTTSLVQLRLPSESMVQEIAPPPIETVQTPSRLIVTVQANTQVQGVVQ